MGVWARVHCVLDHTNSEMTVEDRKKQLRELNHIVLGIRLFNRAVEKGGAGLIDAFGIVGAEVNDLCERLREETQAMYDETLCYTEVLNLEFRQSGSISASWARLQDELAHRRQYAHRRDGLLAGLLALLCSVLFCSVSFCSGCCQSLP